MYCAKTTNQSMKIIPYEKMYFEGVASVLCEISAFYNPNSPSSKRAIRLNLENNILGKNSDIRILIATDKDVVVGLAMYSILYPAPKETGQLFLKELYTMKNHRGKGVGLALMKYLADIAVNHNCGRFDWTVDRSNEAAVGFYNRIGASAMNKLYFRIEGSILKEFAKSK